MSKRRNWTPAEIIDYCRENAYTSVEIAGEWLGKGRSAAYAARDNGVIPVIRVSKRDHKVPTAEMLRVLKLDPH